MSKGRVRPISIAILGVAIFAGVVAWRYAQLELWEPAFPGLLVAMSMLGAAVLVRLARNAPITAPTTFDDADLKQFFDTLELLAKRLFALFMQVVATICVVVLAIVVVHRLKNSGAPAWFLVAPYVSGFLAFMLFWVVCRLAEMTYGDLGFLRLQRRILERALERERRKEASKKVAGPVEWQASGDYGRALPKLDD